MSRLINQRQGGAIHYSVRAVCLVLLVAVPLLQAFRGLDMTDMGFVLTNQRLVLSHPEHVTYWFHLWLTNVVGGLVDLVFGGFGVLPHKIAAAVIYWLTAAGVFLLYRRSARRDIVLLAVTVSLAFAFANKINVVHYNNLSAFFYVLGAVLLSEGVLQRKGWLFALSGFILGLNVFARLPNIVGLGLIFIPSLLDLVTRDPTRKSKVGMKAFGFFFFGAAVAMAAALSAMALLGHLQYYFSAVRDLSKTSARDSGVYSLGRLILLLGADTCLSLVFGIVLAAWLVAASAVFSFLKNRWLRALVGLALAGAVYGLVAAPVLKLGGMRLVFRMSAGLCYLAALWMLFNRQASQELRFTAVLGACLSLALNLGSDTGIGVSSYVFPAMFPALLAAAESQVNVPKLFLKRSGYSPLLALPLVIAAFFLGFSTYLIKNRVYRDVSAMRYTVDYPQLRGIFTSQARAEILQDSLPVISSFVPPGGVLFAYDSVPLLHFAAKTGPYLGNPWPAQFKPAYLDALLKLEESRAPLPVVVLAKRNARGGAWPATRALPVHLEPVLAFLERNGYRLAWQNSAFELYIPQAP